MQCAKLQIIRLLVNAHLDIQEIRISSVNLEQTHAIQIHVELVPSAKLIMVVQYVSVQKE